MNRQRTTFTAQATTKHHFPLISQGYGIKLVLALCATALPWDSQAEPVTNRAYIEYWATEANIEQKTLSEELVTRFLEEVVTSDDIVFDRFAGPSSQLAWARKRDDLGYDSFEKFNNDGAKLFATIGLDSLRTAAIAALPLDMWEENWEQWLAGFLKGSVGNPEEEHIDSRSMSYSAVRSSWERANEHVGIRLGIRPWRSNPYVYFLANAGRWDGRPLVTLEGRAGYTLFRAARLEARLTFQLPENWRLSAGGAINPEKMGSDDPDAGRISITLEKVVSHGEQEGIFFLGFRSGRRGSDSNSYHENLFLAGISRPW